jgi:hypothetical protein
MVWARQEDLVEFEYGSDDEPIPGYPGAQHGNRRVFLRHKPTGVELWGGRDTDVRNGILFYKFGPGYFGDWQVEIELLIDGDGFRADELGFDQSDLHWSRAFRKIYGKKFTVTHLHDVAGKAAPAWQPDLIKVLLRALLIKRDSSAFRSERDPNPDHIVFSPVELPTQLHAELTNPVAEIQS